MILYEDKDIIVCHKQAGIPVQTASSRTKDMESILRTYLAQKAQKPEQELYVVHRLDQPVEGIVVFARNKKAAASLTRQINEGSMKKIYHALCQVQEKTEDGEKLWEDFAVRQVTGAEMLLEDYLQKDGRTNTSRIVSKNAKDAKQASLAYRVLAVYPEQRCIRVKIDLHTGRHHQIRVQMAHAGLPLVGDRKYGTENTPGICPGLALCAVSLTFLHPSKGKKMTFETNPTGWNLSQL